MNPVTLNMFLFSYHSWKSEDTRHFPVQSSKELLLTLGESAELCLYRDFGGYFHFLMEVLPVAIRIQETHGGLLRVASSLCRHYPFIEQLFCIYQISFRVDDQEPIQPIEAAPWQRVIELLKTSRMPYHYPSYAAVMALKDRISMFLDSGQSGVLPQIHGNRRLLILRRNDDTKNSRAMVNEADVIACLQEFGFQAIYCEDYSCRKQIDLFANSDMIVGVHGAGLTNAVYMRPGAKLLELMPTTELKWHYAVLARFCKLCYGCLLIETVTSNADRRPDTVRINVESLRTKVFQMLSEINRSTW